MMKKKMKKRRSQIGSFGSLADVNSFRRMQDSKSGSTAFDDSDSEEDDGPAAAKEVKDVHDMRARARSQVRRKNDRERAGALFLGRDKMLHVKLY